MTDDERTAQPPRPEHPAAQSAASSSGPSPRVMRTFKIVAGVVVLALVGLVGWAIWVAGRPTVAPPAPPFDRFESAWSSAMAKAGVEATFPVGPVELAELKPTGRRPFEATFTAEEVSALLSVYRYTGDIAGSDIAISSVEVAFPTAGTVRIDGTLVSGGTGYSAVAEGPVRYLDGRIESSGLTALTVEGFSIGGARRQQAGEGLVQYFNKYLDAALGLTIESAEIVDGGVAVRGFAPVSLTNPPAQ